MTCFCVYTVSVYNSQVTQLTSNVKLHMMYVYILCFRSGTEEQYGEKEQLLQQIVDMTRDFLSKKKAST